MNLLSPAFLLITPQLLRWLNKRRAEQAGGRLVRCGTLKTEQNEGVFTK